MTGNVEIKVLFFAGLREQLGLPSIQSKLQAPLTVASLQQQLASQGAPWHVMQSEHLLCAVNKEIVSPEHVVRAGDEVAFFPPVTGG